jgi:peptidoglycan/LPS O-acetylase OafA/YrhL
MPKPVANAPHIAYRPGLDGLRAIAVASVFLYHARIDWLPGGFLGVDLFFVLSGYLITSLLLVEWEARNQIDLRRFWLRRGRRLLPALVVVVLASLILAAIFARGDLARTRSDVVSSLLYYANWHQIIANHSYFNLMGNPSLLQHTWSLGVEEQFYIVWPLLLVPGLVLVGRKRLPMLVITGIAASAALMWILYTNPSNPSRVYYGTDTRAFLLLMGILLALVWPKIEELGRRALPLLELLGIAALVGSVLLFLQMHDFNPTLYQGGDLAAAFCFTVLIAAVAHRSTGIGQAIGVAPLRWIGERSYGIYLWHWPIILLVAGVNARPNAGVVVGEAAIVVAAAALSYRYVEQPIRTRSLQRWLSQYSRRFRYEVVGAGALGLVAAFAILFVTPAALNPVGGYVSPTKANAGTDHPQPSNHPRTQPVSEPTSQGGDSTQPKGPLPPGRILALGDSVMLGCSSQLRTALHHRVHVDATVGRQIEDTVDDLQRLRRHDKLTKTIVIQVGNNGPLWYRDLVRLRHALHGIPRIVVVNVRNDTSWQDESNHALATWVHGWQEAHLADWYGSSTAKMMQDGTHPWPYGCTIYARLIADTLRSA